MPAVGSIQRKLKNYKESYNHCLWLRDNVKRKKEKLSSSLITCIHIFSQRSGSRILKGSLDIITEVTAKDWISKSWYGSQMLCMRIISIFLRQAESLFLHKNTLIYKLKKYEETFQIDIRGDFKGGFLFILIASMMKEYQKRQQVGEDI